MNEYAFLARQKQIIGEYLRNYFSRQVTLPLAADGFNLDVLNRLLDFALQGKMIRGGAAALGFSLYSSGDSDVTAPLGAAMEMIQSALLIHDDIMDRDTERRGGPSLYYQYTVDAGKAGVEDAYHTGEALGICAGDVAFFLAVDMIGSLQLPPERIIALLPLMGREISLVGQAQMHDVLRGASLSAVTADDVLQLYRYKTARYTFSLPLMAGAIAAGTDQRELTPLEKLGENLGILFQIRDDEIGLLGNKEKTGKPVGSDIREGKQTLHYIYLKEKVSGKDESELDSIYGNHSASESDIRRVLALIDKYSVEDHVLVTAEKLKSSAEKQLEEIPTGHGGSKEVLKALLEHSMSRET